ncbi:MAG TPA: hypothetical protein VFI45_00155, partial [Candidatus Acidoferrum sp.]|nr:hypothetical protein [Candidatus Acidoferrum sp.]
SDSRAANAAAPKSIGTPESRPPIAAKVATAAIRRTIQSEPILVQVCLPVERVQIKTPANRHG